MSRRVVVPDTSVVVEALLGGPHTRPANRLLDAIERHLVTAFAPHALICEFVKTACEMRMGHGRRRRHEADFVDEQVERFFALEITYVRESQLQEHAYRLACEDKVPPPDA